MFRLLVCVYLTSLVSFSFVSHPVMLCALLLLKGLSLSGFVYLLIGVSWYVVLFCIVYVGGVYVLFVYVSIYKPKTFPILSGGYGLYFFLFFFFFFFFSSIDDYCVAFEECSHFVYSHWEGYSYVLLCVVLLFSFVVVSRVVRFKDSFFR